MHTQAILISFKALSLDQPCWSSRSHFQLQPRQCLLTVSYPQSIKFHGSYNKKPPMSTQQQSQTLTDPPLDSSSSTPTVINRIGQLKHHLNQSSDSFHQTKNMLVMATSLFPYSSNFIPHLNPWLIPGFLPILLFPRAAPKGDIGLIGLALQGRRVSGESSQRLNVIGAHSVAELCENLKTPRRIILLVKAGDAVDAFIQQLEPHLEKGDIIIDGGNSHFPDTNRRCKELEAKGLLFVGSGVSGGEEGARYGPSLMPGGSEAAWPHIKEIFQKAAAQSEGESCCDWVGQGGSGHYVKMVHNGIEYGDMQLICEAYDILKRGLGLNEGEIGDIFATWNKGVLDSFLMEITRDILKYNDTDGTPLVTKILDKAGQKGTGKWTAINALDLGMPVTLIGEAVFARCLSGIKEERVKASKVLGGPQIEAFKGDKKQFIDDLEQAMLHVDERGCQGIRLDFELPIHCTHVARWLYHPISLLGEITKAFRAEPELQNLLFNDFFNQAIHKSQPGWRRIIAQTSLGVSPLQPSRLLWHSSTVTELPTSLPVYYRPRETTSELTPSEFSQNTRLRPTPKAKTSTLTGPVAVVRFLHHLRRMKQSKLSASVG
ncbi:hypothetical protein KEM48_004017 [Puccinia striiformis f. sp. tritici PST-130]|nr:hypothetical protein KEM48_004017 [Puccinia striiformis f. sp. tritici PST-130]